MKSMTAKHGGTKPEFRLPPLIPGSLFIPAGLFLYGWSADKGVQWMVPIIGTSMVGLGLMATFVSIPRILPRPPRLSVMARPPVTMLTSFTDAHPDVLDRRIHDPCSFSDSGEHCPA
jgi:hypothetical protein